VGVTPGLTLGVDIGTSSSKGVLLDADGRLVAEASRPHPVGSPHPGWFEHDAESTWWADFTAITADLLAAAPAPVDAVAVSGIGPCLLPTDAAGTPLRPAILYGVDTRATAQIAAQIDRLGADTVLERCHAPITSQAVGPKFAWIAEHEPDVYASTKRWFMASSFVAHRLTGAYVLDHHSASQAVPLYAPDEHAWIDAWCDLLAPGVEFPALAWPGDVIGTVTARAAELTGLPVGCPVLAGTIDAWSEAVSVGVTAPGDTMIMYGTTMFLVCVTDRPHSAPTLWGTVGAFPGTSCLAGGMATSGAITSWLTDLTGTDFTTLTHEAAAIPAGADGLLMLPYFAGERSPLFDPLARGVIAGLTLHHTRGHLYRAALEATAFGVRHNLEAMHQAGASPTRLVAVGGGTTGGLWTSIVSDITGKPQQLPTHTMGAAFGDAFLAALATGAATRDDIATWNPITSTIEPDPAHRSLYDERYGSYLDLYTATQPCVHAIARQAPVD
jgi:xylulokinase